MADISSSQAFESRNSHLVTCRSRYMLNWICHNVLLRRFGWEFQFCRQQWQLRKHTGARLTTRM